MPQAAILGKGGKQKFPIGALCVNRVFMFSVSAPAGKT